MSISPKPTEEIVPKNIVLLLEDEQKIIDPFVALFEAKELNAQLIVCKTLAEYLEVFKANDKHVKCMVMDLNNQDKSTTSIAETIAQIKLHHENNRMPIFVHSGNLEHFTELNEKGTIIKKEKNSKSIEEIIDSIDLMLKSGFLNIFSINGTLDEKIMSEIHSAFINQFKHNEIEEIIKSIQKVTPNEPDFSNRINEVFERIAIRSIYQNFINNDSVNNSVTVNAIEHYYRRTNISKHCFYTGDIFEDGDKKMYFVATPRCDISNKKFEKILLCEINQIEEQHGFSSKNAQKNIQSSITDNVTNINIAERYRFLPPSPQFKGGFVDFRKIITVCEDELEGFNLIISLVDDLTNDVVRKLASYLLRGGISDTAYEEALYYVKNNSSEETAKA